MSRSHPSMPRLGVIAALGAVYVLWGSTYLAIRFAIETLPPLLMAGTRFVIAGGILYAWVEIRGGPRPEARHWGPAALAGGLLLLGGNGFVSVAERWVASGVAALLVATVPLWMVLLDWTRTGGVRPRAGAALGVVIGFAGVAVLVGSAGGADGGTVDPFGAALLIFAALSWAVGSLYSRRARLPRSPLLATAMQMLCGGGLLLVAGLVTGEGTQVHLAAISARSLLSLAYLIVAGSLVAFTCYSWLLRVASTPVVSTYAYVNPVVAVLLGWSIAAEPLTPRTWIATTIIVAAVALITLSRAPAVGERDRRLTRPLGPARGVEPSETGPGCRAGASSGGSA